MTKEELIAFVDENGMDYIHIDWPEFQNTKIHGINKSRYVASWIKADAASRQFKEWLKTLVIDGTQLTDDEIRQIYNFATNGKFELQASAIKFIAEQKQ